VNADGTLTYSFVEALQASYPFYFIRFVGGLFIITGMFVMAYNTYKTITDSSTELDPVNKAAGEPA
ncbi:MAG: hypothetical protein ACRC7Q_14150, partial [Plesiomonas shigelloides]